MTRNYAEANLVRYFSYLITISLTFSVAHKIYGVPQTINTANYVFFLAYKELISLRDQDSFEHEQERRLDTIVTGVYSSYFLLQLAVHCFSHRGASFLTSRARYRDLLA